MNYMLKLARSQKTATFLIVTGLFLTGWYSQAWGATLKIGLNYPASGPYWIMGLAQNSAATMAVEEINAGGGILGNTIELVKRDSKSKILTTSPCKPYMRCEANRPLWSKAIRTNWTILISLTPFQAQRPCAPVKSGKRCVSPPASLLCLNSCPVSNSV